MRHVIDLIVGMFIGGLAVTLFVLFLFIFANMAFGDESVSTRPARLGEQDRSLNYKYTDSSGVEFEHVIVLSDTTADTLAEDMRWCRERNERLTVSKEYIAEYVKKWPKHAHFFAEALKVIEETWCHDYPHD